MNLMTKLGVVTLAAIMVTPLSIVNNPTVAQAKTVKKTKKVSKKRPRLIRLVKTYYGQKRVI